MKNGLNFVQKAVIDCWEKVMEDVVPIWAQFKDQNAVDVVPIANGVQLR